MNTRFCWCFFQRHIFFLVFLLTAGLAVRLYSLNTPLADWHSWRQADTASVTREYIKHRYPLLLPHYQDLSDIPSGKENVAGYRMVEFPIENYLIAQFLIAFPRFDLVVTSRLVSIFFSLISIAMLYVLVFQLTGKKLLAFFCAAVFALMPYSIYYSRVILPEPTMLAFQLLSLVAFTQWVRLIKEKKSLVLRGLYGLLSTFSFAIALLLKPMAAFVGPVYPVIAFGTLGWSAFTSFELYLFPALVFLPLAWWRHWILQFPSGIPASDWLYNQTGIRLRPAWWRWLFADRIGRLMMGYWGAAFLFLGAIVQFGQKKLSLFDWVTIVWFLGMFAYLVVFATGNVQHDYYQIMLVPIISILFGRGVWAVGSLLREGHSPFVLIPVTLLVLALTGYFSWYEVSGYYHINNWAIVAAGKEIDKITPPDATIVAEYGGDTAFLFQTNRTGWPVGNKIDDKIKEGASYFVTTSEDDEAKTFEKKYPIVEKTPLFLILKLSP